MCSCPGAALPVLDSWTAQESHKASLEWHQSESRTSAGCPRAGNIFKIHLPLHLSPRKLPDLWNEKQEFGGVDYPWAQCSGEAQGIDSMNSWFILVSPYKKEFKLSEQHLSPQVIPVGALKGHKQTKTWAFQPKKSPVFMLLFILLKSETSGFQQGAGELWPSRYFLCPKHSYCQNCTQTAIQALWGKCPEHSLVQLKPLAGSEAMSWLSQGLGFAAHALNSSAHRGDAQCLAGFWSCLTKTRYSLGALREGTALIHQEKMLQLKFPSIEKPDWECNYPN